MKRKTVCALSWGGIALALFSSPSPGLAQDSSLRIEEIVVTAQKREEGLQDVPIAISVVTGESLARTSVRNLEEVSTTTPGFHMIQSPAQSGIFIRSVGSSASNQGFEQSVGLFVDGVHAGRDRLFQAPFLDIERVEILKGPQSVILGKNTTAGAVNITTAKPTDHFEGSVSALYGEDGEYAATVIVSGPLSETFSGRVAARASGMDGYLRNTFTANDEPGVDDLAFRGTIRWQPNDDLRVLFKADYARSRQDGNALVPSVLTPQQLGLAQMFDPAIIVDVDSKTKSADSTNLASDAEYNDLNAHNFTLTADYSFSEWTLTSITAFAGLDYEQGTDADHLPISLAAISLVVGSDYEQFSQELRLTSPVGRAFELMTGAHYQYGDTKFLTWMPCVNFASVPGPGLPSSFCAPAHWTQEQDAVSAFARGTWNITDSLRATAGLRYTHDDKEADNELTITQLDGVTPNSNPFDLAIALGVGGWANHVIPRTSRTETSWSPSFNLQYDVVPDVMVYASYTKGSKGGGFNPLNGTGALDAWMFDAEEAESYEVGAKTQLFNDRAALNFAAFSSEISDFQVSQFDGVTFTVTNAGSVKVDGIETDFRWRATQQLMLSGAVSYLDSRYGTFVTAPCQSGQTPAEGCVGGVQNLSGEVLQFAPDWTATIAAEYAKEIGTDFLATFQADLFYSDEYMLAPDNDPRAVQSGYSKVNARIGFGPIDGKWEIAFVGKNLTDEVTKNFENDIVGFANAFFAHVTRGRSVAAQATISF